MKYLSAIKSFVIRLVAFCALLSIGSPMQAAGIKSMTVTISGNTTVCTGSSVSFSATAMNYSGTLTFQWRKNGSNVSSSVMGPPPYVLVLNSINNGDVITCFVTSTGSGSATSNALTVTVTSAQTFSASASPNNIYFCAGAPVTYTATSGFSLTSYQWQMNGINVSGANSSTFSTTATSVAQLQSVRVFVTTNSGCVTSTSATGSAANIPFVVNPNVTPSVSISSSAGTSICSGTSVTYTANPVNGGGPSYQWRIDGSAVGGATASTFTTSSLANGQQVSCVMTSNASCATPSTVTSNTITMTVSVPQTMTVNVSGSSGVCQGSTASFSASVTGSSGNLTYQWKKNGSNVSSGITGPPPYVLVLNSVNNNDVISCVVTSDAACVSPVTSGGYTVTVNPPQAFSVYPAPQTIYFCSGDAVTFTANANFSTTGTYQWQMNGSTVAGVTGNTFSTTASSVAQLQSVTVSASTNAGCVSNTFATGAATNIPFVVNSITTPSVTIASGSGINVCSGAAVTFTASPMNGGSTPAYQWRVDGTVVPGVTGGSFTTSQLTNGQQVSCVMTTSLPCATTSTASSNILTMGVNPSGAMTLSIAGPSTICQGSEAYFSATVGNYSGTLTFHWMKNGSPVTTDVTGPPPYVLGLSTVNNNDVITLTVTADNGCSGPVTSNSVTAVVTQRQPFTVNPSPPTIYFCQDQSVTFTANSNFPTTGVYQWQVNGQVVGGTTGNTFTTTASSVAQLHSVTVSAYASGGCVSNTYATGSEPNIPYVINPVLAASVSIAQTPVPVLQGSPATFTAVPVNGGTSPGYQWKLNGVDVVGATAAIYAPTISSGDEIQSISVSMHSNATCANNPSTAGYYVKIASAKWEDLNYIRIHDVQIPGVMDWIAADNLPTGQKLVNTTYYDGLDRPVQKVARESGTPQPGNSQWQDLVQPMEYDAFGRSPKHYLTYATTTNPMMFKTSAVGDEATYYTANYSETSAYEQLSYDASTLNRVTNVKEPGGKWAAGTGKSMAYLLNDQLADNVQMWSVGYGSTDYPVSAGAYPSNTLFKTQYTDDNGKITVGYTDNGGRQVLRKVQVSDNPSTSHSGWICTYTVYDDYGQVRFIIQPEAVNYLDQNGWSFAGVNGQTVLNEQCFRYAFDEKKRLVTKKAPGSKEITMIYDARDRLVFNQDGAQRAKSPGEWQVIFYDQLDRAVMSGLYNTTRTVASLQSDAAQASGQAVISTAEASLTVYANAVAPADISNPSVFTTLRYDFYDNYDYGGARAFDNGFTNGVAYPSGDPVVMAIAPTLRVTGLVTGSKVRVLGTGNFLLSTFYYDEKGRSIQTLADNIKSGTDITTNQYHFDGRLLSKDVRHSAGGTPYTGYDLLTKHVYDLIGREIALYKKFGAADWVQVVDQAYDDLGRIRAKRLAPGYTGNGGNELEALAFSYNIHSEITGINKDYALKTPGQYDKWGHFFGMYLGYENTDQVFAKSRLDGHITGMIWSTQGDDVQRKYEYDYDDAGRLIKAAFTQRQQTGNSWDNAKVDFSVSGYNGQIEYDLNGNIRTMMQKGILPGQASPVTVDDLRYSYNPYSNRLAKVYDNGTMGANNGKLGDFKDGSNGGSASSDDYVYDDNGNLVKDLNKEVKDLGNVVGANGIAYNYLDKPESVRIAGKGVIQFVYDANGKKLEKIYTPDGGTAVTTFYVNELVYQDNQLQYVDFEEGRLRVLQAVSQDNGLDQMAIDGNIDMPGGKRGAFDYFIRDHLGNIRMVLTEETHTGRNVCTMETGRASVEEPLFGQVDANGTPSSNNEVKDRFASASIPGQASGNGWNNSAIGDNVSRLSSLTKKVGPNALLKVMAGDQVSAQAIYYYQAPVTNDAGGSTIVNDLLISLGSAIGGSPVTNGLTKSAMNDITSGLNNATPFTSLIKHNPAGESVPRAYLYILFFDEQFNFIGEGSTSARVSQSGDGASPLIIPNVKAPRNGYAYVYIGNESEAMVYFDNLQVSHVRGRIVEEDHYYAYGLKMAGISSHKVGEANYEGKLANSNLFNDKELTDEGDLNWYDYGFRNYDPQIGRFVQSDPLTDDYPDLTQYQYASCEPIANIDLDGLEQEAVTEVIGNTRFIIKTTAVSVELISATRAIGEVNWISTMAEVVVVGKRAVTATSVLSSFFEGVVDGLKATAVGLYTVVRHPLNTITALGTAVLHPIDTYNSIKETVVDTYHEFVNGDANTRSKMFGNLVGQLAGGYGTGKLLAGVGSLAAKAALASERAALVIEETEATLTNTANRLHPGALEKGYQVRLKPSGAPEFGDYLHPVEPGQSQVVRIKLTGDYGKDFRAANKAAKIKTKPNTATWHHVEDFDPVSGEGTMQLVQRDVHAATSHSGGVSQYRAVHGAGYR